MNNNIQGVKWSENVIIIDANYVDKVAFNLIVNFERMLGRPIPQADMARWIDCVALDGGLRQGAHQTQVILIHSKDKHRLSNFVPADYVSDLTNKAFKDHLGEFFFDSYTTDEDIVSYNDFFADALELVASQKEIKRLMVIPNAEDDYIYNKVRAALNHLDDDEKRVTVFAMQPMPGGNFRQEILGYSLMAALGITSEEINKSTNQ